MIIVKLIRIDQYYLLKMKDGIKEWGKAFSTRETSDITYSIAELFAGSGAYHSH
jgi:hypothetical protein